MELAGANVPDEFTSAGTTFP